MRFIWTINVAEVNAILKFTSEIVEMIDCSSISVCFTADEDDYPGEGATLNAFDVVVFSYQMHVWGVLPHKIGKRFCHDSFLGSFIDNFFCDFRDIFL